MATEMRKVISGHPANAKPVVSLLQDHISSKRSGDSS
jgi:hypothetical protein